MKILVNPDIHGRTFWTNGIERIGDFDKIIFLGDYLDPYHFENIDVESAIANFIDIMCFAKENADKVVLLLGNHDIAYYSPAAHKTGLYGCRHLIAHHGQISSLFSENTDLFKIAHYEGGILFTHAGVTPLWLRVITNEPLTTEQLCDRLNDFLTEDLGGGSPLHMVSAYRGGYDVSGSCIWADVREMVSRDIKRFIGFRQVFGHTLLAYDGADGEIHYGNPIESDNWKMLDTACAYKLDTDSFKITQMK